MLRANLLTVELDEASYASGFAHAGTSVTATLGTERLGAGVYEAQAGVPIWPYHYHHGVEEWLLVLAGSPVLREPAGRRVLAAGDLIAFPSGRLGAHTVEGPGRFVMFSGKHRGAPSVGVFPDSDKVSGPEGLMLRGPAVRYWHREGTGALDAELGEREPIVLDGPPRPALNVTSVEVGYRVDDDPAGFRARSAMLGPSLGAEMLGATVQDLDPGEGSAPYHYEVGREEAVIVLAGTPTLRHPDGHDPLTVGEVVFFLEGPSGAHRLINRSDRLARVMFMSTKGLPSSVCYPDSRKWALRNGPHAPDVLLREDDTVGYWDGEA